MRTVLFIVGFVGAGLVGAVFGQMLFPDDAPLPGRSEDQSRLEAQVDDLAAEVEVLKTAIREERDSRPLPETPFSPVPSDAVTAGNPVAGTAAAPPPADTRTLISDEVIEEKVRETVVEIAREQQRERARQAEAKQVATETAWLKGMQSDLRMTDYQVEEIGKLLILRRRAMEVYKQKRDALGQDATPQQKARLQQEMTDYRESLKTEVLKVVSVEQYEGMVRKGQEARKQAARGR